VVSYVKRMMRKPGSGIDSAAGKKIYESHYDSSVRKKRCSMESSPS